MPPTYKPLSVGIQGLPPEIFGAPEVHSINDYVKENEAVETQQLNNEVQALQLAEKQRIAEENQRMREELQSSFRNNSDDGVEFDQDHVLDVIGRVAGQQGDADTLLKVQEIQAKGQGGSRRLLTPEQRLRYKQMFNLDYGEGSTMADVTTDAQLMRSQAYDEYVGGYINSPGRAKGERENTMGRDLPGSAVEKLGAMEGLVGLVDNVKERYLKDVPTSRGERFVEATLNPNSASARLNRELSVVAKQLGNAHEGQRLSDQDFEVYKGMITPGDLDTFDTMVDRLDRLKSIMAIKKRSMLAALKAGRFNTSAFEPQTSTVVPQHPNEEPPGEPQGGGLSAEEAAYKEQFKAKLRARRNLQ